MRAHAIALALLSLGALPARAADNDFRLNAQRDGRGILYVQQTCGTDVCYAADNEQFRQFVTQLGFVLAPRLASPAETLGHSGFHVGLMWSGSTVASDQAYWGITDAGQRGTPKGFLQTLQLDVRKGLPFSFEIGTNLTWLVESEVFAPGLELRWALHEGFAYTPDLGVRASVSHAVGNRDLNLTTVGLDAVISKGFGLFGMVHVAPYLSWSLVMIAASSRVIDPTPLDDLDVYRNIVFQDIQPTSRLNHKLTVGVRTVYYVLNVSLQGEFQVLGKDPGSVATITTKLGLDF